jgi:hypothetical protein
LHECRRRLPSRKFASSIELAPKDAFQQGPDHRGRVAVRRALGIGASVNSERAARRRVARKASARSTSTAPSSIACAGRPSEGAHAARFTSFTSTSVQEEQRTTSKSGSPPSLGTVRTRFMLPPQEGQRRSGRLSAKIMLAPPIADPTQKRYWVDSGVGAQNGCGKATRPNFQATARNPRRRFGLGPPDGTYDAPAPLPVEEPRPFVWGRAFSA